MIPVVTPEEMRSIDAEATDSVEVLIERAGAAVARVAVEVLGGPYGRRVIVIAGKGNNGADGRAAARRLRQRGIAVKVFDAANCPAVLPHCDLVIDAAYGTGFHGQYSGPETGDALVLAVDVPSGSVRADVTVTFAALKPGLVFSDRAGLVLVEDIGLDVSRATTHVVEASDVLANVRSRRRDANKYDSAVAVVAGSPGMTGAAALTSRAALRSGAGYCRLAIPGGELSEVAPSEVVAVNLPGEGWADAALAACDRMKALAIGPGIGRADATVTEVRRVLEAAALPVVVDADALFALGKIEEAEELLAARTSATVLTPHDGEFARLAGEQAGEDRLASVRTVAERLGVTVLLKGPVTVVADPDGGALLSMLGTPALATAGTGDVLTGVIAAFLALGMPPLEAAGVAATAHSLAALSGPSVGLVAGDLLDLLPTVLSGG